MCEHRPSLGESLEQDHNRIDEHFARFDRALQQGNVDTAAFAAGNSCLRRHIYLEEAYQFPKVRAAGLLAPVMVMLREHGQIWDLLDEIWEMIEADLPASAFSGIWQQLKQTLADHNLKEENIVYPFGDQVLDADLADEIIASLSSGEAPISWVCQMGGQAAHPQARVAHP